MACLRTVKCFVYGEEADMRRAVAQRVQRECVWSYCRLLHQAGLSVQCTSLLFSLCLFTHPASKYTPLEKPLEKIPPSSTQCAKNTLPRPPLQPPAFCACLSFGPLPPPLLRLLLSLLLIVVSLLNTSSLTYLTFLCAVISFCPFLLFFLLPHTFLCGPLSDRHPSIHAPSQPLWVQLLV